MQNNDRSNSNDHPYQRFQSKTHQPLDSLELHEDPATGAHFVLWKTIQWAFGNIDYLLNGSVRVFFMVDGDFEVLNPLRIRHHPGVALTVILKDPTDSLEVVKQLTITDAQPLTYPSDNIYSPHTTATTTVANTARSRRSIIETQQAFQAYRTLHNSLSQALTLGQKELACSLITSMDRHYSQLQLEIAKNFTLSGQIVESQTQILQMQHDAAKMQQQMQDTLQEALGRLALIQSRIQALLTQTFELHEYPIPRLFIVLPKDRELWDNLNPFTHKFRLYFLCECGEHTRSADSTIPHHIHLAKHEGYDLERPTDFFRKYGTYILTMMEMVRFGIATAGIVVPVLEQSRLLDGMDEISKTFALTKEAFGSLVNDAINYVQSHTESEGFMNAEEEGEFQMTGREALEGADLRLLASFLGSKDKARTLGNLYRVITKEGHVKWVCLNHYRENYKSSASAQLEEVVKVLDGTYDEQQGVVRVSLSSRTVADQFYEALAVAKGVQELSLKLAWDVTKGDLQRLQSEITKSGIACLEIDGAMFDNPSLDIVNRNSRFDPLVRMVVSAQLQSFSLLNCPRFLERISDFRKKTGSSLRRLMLSEVFPPKVSTSTQDTLLKLLQCFPQLNDFGFSVEADIERTLALLQHPIRGHERLSTISLYADKETEAVFQVLDDTILGLSSAIFPSRIDTVHFNSGYLRLLSITRIISPDFRPVLRGILHTSPHLTDISISIDSYDILFEMAFFRQHASWISTLLRVVFTDIVSKNTIASVVYSPATSSSSSLKHEILPRYTASPLARGHKRYLSSQRIAMDVQEWNYEFISGSIRDDEAAALDRATEQHPNVVHKWSLDISRLSRLGLQHVARVLSRSDLSLLTMICQPIDNKDDLQEDIVSFLAEVPWCKIRKIAVIGEAVDEWLTVLYQSWQRHSAQEEKKSDDTPNRQSFGPPQWFEVHCMGTKQKISHTSVLWIQSMLSSFSVRSLRLCNLDLEDLDWSLIMDVIDFSKLQQLSLRKSNIAQLDRLLERVPVNAPLQKLILMFTAWSMTATDNEREKMLRQFREKAPEVQWSLIPPI